MFTLEKASDATLLFRERTMYPFATMGIGDSLIMNEFKKAESARVAAIQFVKRRGLDWKFSMQKSREGWRIQRIR